MSGLKCRIPSVVVFAILVFVLMAGCLAMADDADQVIKISAKRFEYNPGVITVKKGVPVILEFTSLDRLHGFNCPGLRIRTDIPPGKVTNLRFVPQDAGTFGFHCDVFCGSGHDGMSGSIVVVE